MILTLKPTLQNGYASPHAYSPLQQPAHSSTFSPQIKPAALPPLPTSSPRKMGTPHRGLPPPSAMTLPNPERRPSSGAMSIGPLPRAPESWNGAEESMRSWLAAKTEEEKRKAEEQRTQQATLMLEQRKIEQSILHESLQGGIPPYMVPMVFAGLAGGPVAQSALEWTQQAVATISLQQQAQLQQQQQQAQQQPQQHPQPNQPSTQNAPDQRRMITGPQPNPYGPQPGQQVPAPAPQVQSNIGFVPSYQPSNVPVERPRLPGPPSSVSSSTLTFTSASRQPASSLPRLNTVDSTPLQQPPPTHGGLALPAQHALSQPQQPQQPEQQVSSPLYFHHWVPPNTQTTSNKDPGTPTGKSQHDSPFSQSQSSYLRSDYANSPKKRKLTGGHQAAPATSSGPAGPAGPPETSPSFSHTSSGSMSGNRRRNRSRQHSDASSRAINEPSNARRPRSRTASGRQSVSEAESGSQRHNSAQPETRPSQQQQQHHHRSAGSYEHSGHHSPKREGKETS
ncbi:hypothetical protein Q9189_002821 [Teloschistes chrysophthalmus]